MSQRFKRFDKVMTRKGLVTFLSYENFCAGRFNKGWVLFANGLKMWYDPNNIKLHVPEYEL